jgi:hypothetical protein
VVGRETRHVPLVGGWSGDVCMRVCGVRGPGWLLCCGRVCVGRPSVLSGTHHTITLKTTRSV